MSMILGVRGILTTLGLPQLKKDKSSHQQEVVTHYFKQQCHNQRRFRDREMSQVPNDKPSNPAHWQERYYISRVRFRDVFPPWGPILVVEGRPEEIWKEFGSQMVEMWWRRVKVHLWNGGIHG
ncbi:hypothetical protein GOODEAATRI_023315 [Goodea atripinnis]|uniref:Uncharacterized protein n=1 Tax=Goodea atripinnis TaxID=208336 RepID=A0ABV0Q0L4_9TELE